MWMVVAVVARACTACVAGAAWALASGGANAALHFLRLLLTLTRRLDALLQGLLWRLLLDHALYTLALLLLYLLCPPLLSFLLRAKDYLTYLLLRCLRAILTPCLGELPPLFYFAIRLAIDLLSSTTWLELLLQLALDDASPRRRSNDAEPYSFRL